MSLEALIAIVGMAAVTFGIRAGGLLLANRLPTTGFVASWMKHVPAILSGGAAEAIAAAVTALIYIVSRNLFAAMLGGVLAVYLARLALGA